MSETTTEQETRYPNREEQIRSLLDRVIDRAREDIEYIKNDVKISETSQEVLHCADVWAKLLEEDTEKIRDAIYDLEGVLNGYFK